jgi:hypothetical protein
MLNELLVVSQERCYLFGLTVRTGIIGDLYHCYALASADGTNISIIQNGWNLPVRVPILLRIGYNAPKGIYYLDAKLTLGMIAGHQNEFLA